MTWLLHRRKGVSPWLPQRGTQHARVDLVIRTVNLLGGGSRRGKNAGPYGLRVQGIAEELARHWPRSVGLISIQEAEGMICRPIPSHIPGGPYLPDHAVPCLSHFLKMEYGVTISSAWHDGLGILVGPGLAYGDAVWWDIGKESYGKMTWRGRKSRYLLEIKVTHPIEGWTLRFYCTHLSHPNPENTQTKQRKEQIDNLSEIIRDRVGRGELPPIVAGDFNFRPGPHIDEYVKMSEDFRLANEEFDYSPDHIWIGRSTSFPQTRGSYTAVRHQTIDLTREYTIDGLRLGELSDHDCPGMGFKISALRS